MKYQYVIKNNTVQTVGFENTIIVYDIQSWKPEIAIYYRSLLAIRRDMEYAKEYLSQMFLQKDTSLIDGALINCAIQLLVKCFSNPQEKGRRCLDKNKVFRKFAKEIGEEDLTKQFLQFYTARNQVISHDQVNYKENIVGLTISKDSGVAEEVVGLTIRTGYLYKQNQQILLRLVNMVHSYVSSQLQELDTMMVDEFNNIEDKPKLHPIVCENIAMATAW